jgi:hypothetical protein
MNNWQPIEDAIKDGETHVFLLDEYDNVYIGKWDAAAKMPSGTPGGWQIGNFGGTFHASQKMVAFMLLHPDRDEE